MTPANKPCSSCTTPEQVCTTGQEKAVAALAVSVRKDPVLTAVVAKRNRCCPKCEHRS